MKTVLQHVKILIGFAQSINGNCQEDRLMPMHFIPELNATHVSEKKL